MDNFVDAADGANSSVSAKIEEHAEIVQGLITEKENIIINLLVIGKTKKWHATTIALAYLVPPVLALFSSMIFLPFSLLPGLFIHGIYEAISYARRKHCYKETNINDPNHREAFVHALRNLEVGEDLTGAYKLFSVKLRVYLSVLKGAIEFIEEYKKRNEESDIDELSAAAEHHYSSLTSGRINSETVARENLIEIRNELIVITNKKYDTEIRPLVGKRYKRANIGNALSSLGRLLRALKNPLVSSDRQQAIKNEVERLAAGLGLILEGDTAQGRKKYILFPNEKPIGEGGSGEVYKAWDLEEGAERAIKIFKINGDPPQNSAAAREIQILMGLEDNHIIRIFSYGQTKSGRLFAVYPLMNLTLKEIISEQTLTAKKAAEYTLQILAGLRTAHLTGIAHRDMKPANVYVTQPVDPETLEKKDLVIISDLDLAKDIRGGITSIETQQITRQMSTRAPLIGTDQYRGPEFPIFSYLTKKGILKEEKDIETWLFQNDIYAVGCMLYEMMTNTTPFQDSDYATYAINPYENMEAITTMHENGIVGKEIARRLISKKKSPPLEREKIPRPLFKIILKALAYNPCDRYQSVDQFAEDLGKFLKASKN